MFLRVINKRNLKNQARKARESANKIIVAVHWISSSNQKIPQRNVCKIYHLYETINYNFRERKFKKIRSYIKKPCKGH